MAVKPEALIAIEESLADRLRDSWLRIAAPFKAKFEAALAEQDWNQCRALIAVLDPTPVIEENRDYLRYSARQAMLFGASRIRDDLKASAVARGDWTQIIETTTDQMAASIAQGMREQVVATLQRELDEAIAAREGIKKYNKNHDPETGRFASGTSISDGNPLGSNVGGGKPPDPKLNWSDGAAKTIAVKPYGDEFRMNKVSVIKNPTQREVERWNAGEASELRYIADLSTGDLYVWNAEQAIHYQLATALQISDKDPSYTGNFHMPAPVKHFINHVRNIVPYAVEDMQASFPPEMWGDIPANAKKLLDKVTRVSKFEKIWQFFRKPDSFPIEIKKYDTEAYLVQKAGRIVREFVSFGDKGDALLQLIAGLHTSRLASFGFTTEAEVSGVTRYAITEQLDGRVCPVCYAMHGKTFLVSDARASLLSVLRTDNPDDVRVLQPWPKQDSATVKFLQSADETDIVARNWHIPPYHPNCRGHLTLVGKVPPLEQPKPKVVEVAPPPVAAPAPVAAYTREDFSKAGVTYIEQQEVDFWNGNVPLSPTEFLAKMIGVDNAAIIAEAGARGSKSIFLTASLDGEIALSTSRIVGNSKAPVDIAVEVNVLTKRAHVTGVAVAEVDQGTGVVKTLLRDWYDVWDMLGITKVDLLANIEIGGYAWAKYGWRPTLDDWDATVRSIAGAFRNLRAVNEFKEETIKVVERALASKDPRAIWSIADLQESVGAGRTLGKELLMGVNWDGELLLTDSRAMLRFMQYVG